MRNLKNSDLVDLVKIITSCKGVVNDLGSLLYESTEEKEAKTEEQRAADGLQMALTIVNSCLVHAGRDIIEFLASINEMSYEEFDEAGPALIIDTIKGLSEQEGARYFFSNAFNLFLKQVNTKNSITKI